MLSRTLATRQPSKPPAYRRHATGQAFVQHRGKRYYLGVFGTEKSRDRYQRFLPEVWTRPQPQAITPQAPLGTPITIISGSCDRGGTSEGEDERPGDVAGGTRAGCRGRCHWTLQLLADKMVVLGLVDTISIETVRQALKKMTSNRGSSTRGVSRRRPTPSSSGAWRT